MGRKPQIKVNITPKSNLVNQRVYWVYLQEYGRGVSYQSQDNSTAAASWKVHPCIDDNSWKLQPWHSLHDLQKSQIASWWLHLLQAAQLVRAAPPSRCLSLLEPRGGAHSNCLGVNFPKHMTFVYFLSLMNLPILAPPGRDIPSGRKLLPNQQPLLWLWFKPLAYPT